MCPEAPTLIGSAPMYVTSAKTLFNPNLKSSPSFQALGFAIAERGLSHAAHANEGVASFKPDRKVSTSRLTSDSGPAEPTLATRCRVSILNHRSRQGAQPRSKRLTNTYSKLRTSPCPVAGSATKGAANAPMVGALLMKSLISARERSFRRLTLSFPFRTERRQLNAIPRDLSVEDC